MYRAVVEKSNLRILRAPFMRTIGEPDADRIVGATLLRAPLVCAVGEAEVGERFAREE